MVLGLVSHLVELIGKPAQRLGNPGRARRQTAQGRRLVPQEFGMFVRSHNTRDNSAAENFVHIYDPIYFPLFYY